MINFATPPTPAMKAVVNDMFTTVIEVESDMLVDEAHSIRLSDNFEELHTALHELDSLIYVPSGIEKLFGGRIKTLEKILDLREKWESEKTHTLTDEEDLLFYHIFESYTEGVNEPESNMSVEFEGSIGESDEYLFSIENTKITSVNFSNLVDEYFHDTDFLSPIICSDLHKKQDHLLSESQ